jgi:electron transfer flavoprotein beta subunit
LRIAVCCKGVPDEVPLESVHITHGDIHFSNTELCINELDAYALEAAIALKKSYGAETVALTLGPLRALEVLYIALAKGIDRVFRIDGETALPELVASGLTPCLQELSPDLILTGVQSEDWMGAEVGIYLSQTLKTSLAFAVMEISELNEKHVRIKKEIGGGKKAEVRLKLPAVLCVQSGIQPLRYLSAMKLQKVRNTPVKLGGKLDVKAAMEFLSNRMAYEIKEVSLPSREGYAEMITGDRPEMAMKLVEIIKKSV